VVSHLAIIPLKSDGTISAEKVTSLEINNKRNTEGVSFIRLALERLVFPSS